MTYNGDSNYSVDITLAVGSYGFKVASADWSTVDFGANAGEEAVVLGADKSLAVSGANMSLEVTTAGTYRFSVVGPDNTQPVLSVSLLE